MIGELFSIVLPVFGLIGIGFLAASLGLLSRKAGEGLSDFVSAIGIPTLIFRTMATASLPEAQPWGYWIAYFSGLAIVWVSAMTLARRGFGTSQGQSVAAGYAAAQSNTALVGIPLIYRVFGDAGAVPLFLLLAIHLPITLTTATILYQGMAGFSPRRMLRRLLLHPIIVGLALGLAFRFSGLPLAGPAKAIVDQLAGASIPCALIAMGLALHRYGLQADKRLTAAICTLKLLVHPAIVYILAFKVFTMPPVWGGVAVIFAAMPCGINAWLVADHYGEGVAEASSAIAVSTSLCVLTVLFWLWLLGVGAGQM